MTGPSGKRFFCEMHRLDLSALQFLDSLSDLRDDFCAVNAGIAHLVRNAEQMLLAELYDVRLRNFKNGYRLLL